MSNKKQLFIYYSYTGNINSLIPMLCEELNIDTLRIEPTLAYPRKEELFWERYNDEINNKLTPPIKEININFDDYDSIIIATPNWSNTFPPSIRTFLTSGYLKNKTIIPFVTHDRNGEAGIAEEMTMLLEGNNVTSALVFQENQLTKEQVNEFFNQLEY